jgi:hypothetical protein
VLPRPHARAQSEVAFSPDGQTLASADVGPHYFPPDEAAKNQGSVRLWRVG